MNGLKVKTLEFDQVSKSPKSIFFWKDFKKKYPNFTENLKNGHKNLKKTFT